MNYSYSTPTWGTSKLVIWERVGHAPQLEEPERFFLLLSEIVSSEITFALADKAAEKAAANAVEPWPKIGRVDNWRKIGIWIKEKLKGSAK